MIRFFKFLLETLTDQEKSEVAQWKGQTDTAKKYTDHFFGPGVETHEEPLKVTPDKSAIHKSLEDYLGKEISIEDYRAGVIQRGDKQNPMRIGKIKDLPAHILKAFSEDRSRSLKGQKSSEFIVHTTRSKEGVASQTTNNCDWTGSCKRYGGSGPGRRYLESEVQHGTIVSYLRNAQGRDIARTTYQPYTNSEGDVVYRANAHYGATTPDYLAHTKDIEDRLTKSLPNGHGINFELNTNRFYANGADTSLIHPKIGKQYLDDMFEKSTVGLDEKESKSQRDFYDHILGNTQNHKLYPKTVTPEHINKFLTPSKNKEEQENKDYTILRMLRTQHPGINANHLSQLASHDNPDIRLAVLSHPYAPEHVLKNALEDQDKNIRHHAVSQTRFSTPQKMQDFIDHSRKHNYDFLDPLSKHVDLSPEHVKPLLDIIRDDEHDLSKEGINHLTHYNMLHNLLIRHPTLIDQDSITRALDHGLDENHGLANIIAGSGDINLTREHVNKLLTKRPRVIQTLADAQHTNKNFTQFGKDKLHLTHDDVWHHMTTPVKLHYLDAGRELDTGTEYSDRSHFFRTLMRLPNYRNMIQNILPHHPKLADDAATGIAREGGEDDIHHLMSSPHKMSRDTHLAVLRNINENMPDDKNSIKSQLMKRPDIIPDIEKFGLDGEMSSQLAYKANHRVITQMLNTFPVIHHSGFENMMESMGEHDNHIKRAPDNEMKSKLANEKMDIYNKLAERRDLSGHVARKLISNSVYAIVEKHDWMSNKLHEPDIVHTSEDSQSFSKKRLIDSLVNHNKLEVREVAQNHIIHTLSHNHPQTAINKNGTTLFNDNTNGNWRWSPEAAFLRKSVIESPKLTAGVLPKYLATSDDNEFHNFINNKHIDLTHENHRQLILPRNQFSSYTDLFGYDADLASEHRKRQDLVINKLLDSSISKNHPIEEGALSHITDVTSIQHTHKILDEYMHELPITVQKNIGRRAVSLDVPEKRSMLQKLLNRPNTSLHTTLQGDIYQHGSRAQAEELVKRPEFVGSGELIRLGYTKPSETARTHEDAQDNDPAVAMAALNSEHADKKTIDTAVQHKNPEVAMAALKHKNSTTSTAQYAAYHQDPAVVMAALKHYSSWGGKTAIAARHKSPEVAMAALLHEDADNETVYTAARHKDPKVAMAALNHAKAYVQVTHTGAQHLDPAVAMAALTHPQADVQTTHIAMQHQDPAVAIAAINHPLANIATANIGMSHKDPAVPLAILKSKHVDFEATHTGAQHPDPAVALAALAHPQADKKTTFIGIQHSDPKVAMAALAHPQADVETTYTGAYHKNPEVALAALAHPQADATTIEFGATHSDPKVVMAAMAHPQANYLTVRKASEHADSAVVMAALAHPLVDSVVTHNAVLHSDPKVAMAALKHRQADSRTVQYARTFSKDPDVLKQAEFAFKANSALPILF